MVTFAKMDHSNPNQSTEFSNTLLDTIMVDLLFRELLMFFTALKLTKSRLLVGCSLGHIADLLNSMAYIKNKWEDFHKNHRH